MTDLAERMKRLDTDSRFGGFVFDSIYAAFRRFGLRTAIQGIAANIGALLVVPAMLVALNISGHPFDWNNVPHVIVLCLTFLASTFCLRMAAATARFQMADRVCRKDFRTSEKDDYETLMRILIQPNRDEAEKQAMASIVIMVKNIPEDIYRSIPEASDGVENAHGSKVPF